MMIAPSSWTISAFVTLTLVLTMALTSISHPLSGREFPVKAHERTIGQGIKTVAEYGGPAMEVVDRAKPYLSKLWKKFKKPKNDDDEAEDRGADSDDAEEEVEDDDRPRKKSRRRKHKRKQQDSNQLPDVSQLSDQQLGQLEGMSNIATPEDSDSAKALLTLISQEKQRRAGQLGSGGQAPSHYDPNFANPVADQKSSSGGGGTPAIVWILLVLIVLVGGGIGTAYVMKKRKDESSKEKTDKQKSTTGAANGSGKASSKVSSKHSSLSGRAPSGVTGETKKPDVEEEGWFGSFKKTVTDFMVNKLGIPLGNESSKPEAPKPDKSSSSSRLSSSTGPKSALTSKTGGSKSKKKAKSSKLSGIKSNKPPSRIKSTKSTKPKSTTSQTGSGSIKSTGFTRGASHSSSLSGKSNKSRKVSISERAKALADKLDK